MNRRTALACTTLALTVALTATACSSGGGSSHALDVAKLRTLTAPAAAAEDGVDHCPIPLDMARAASDAQLSGPVGEGPAADPAGADPAGGESSATGDEGKPAEGYADGHGTFADESMRGLGTVGGASCTFHVGTTTVDVMAVAVSHGKAFPAQLPMVSQRAGMSPQELTALVPTLTNAAPGAAVFTPNGKVVLLGVPVTAKDGDARVLVSTEPQLTRDQLTSLAQTFAGQLAQVH